MKNKIITIIAVITLISAPLIASAGFWDWLKPLFNQENQQLGVSRVYPFAGGTGQDSSAWTGVVQTSAGTWSASNNISIANATTSGDFYVGGFFRVGGTAGSNLNMANYRILSIGTASTSFDAAGGFIVNSSSTINNGNLTISSDGLATSTISSATSTLAGNLNVKGKSVYGDSNDFWLSAEDNLYIGMDYNANDADIRGIFFIKNTGLNVVPTSANTLLTIAETGSVGIGDDSPDYLLDVAGSLGVDATTTLANVLTVNLEPNNRVGIATTSPRYKLDVWGDMAVGTTTSATSTLLYVDTGDGGKIGVATSTPRYALDVWGNLAIGTTTSALFYADAGNSSITIGGDMTTGNIIFASSSGAITVMDMIVEASASAGTEESYCFNIDSTSSCPFLIYSESDGAGGIKNLRIGIATSTPTTNVSIFNQSATSTTFISSGAVGLGGQIILEDNDGAGCTSITAINGVISGATVTCP